MTKKKRKKTFGSRLEMTNKGTARWARPRARLLGAQLIAYKYPRPNHNNTHDSSSSSASPPPASVEPEPGLDRFRKCVKYLLQWEASAGGRADVQRPFCSSMPLLLEPSRVHGVLPEGDAGGQLRLRRVQERAEGTEDLVHGPRSVRHELARATTFSGFTRFAAFLACASFNVSGHSSCGTTFTIFFPGFTLPASVKCTRPGISA